MSRFLPALAALIALACLVAGSATVSAQTPTIGTLIKNTGQTNSWNIAFDEDFALPFTTGPSSEGYKLTSVSLEASFGSPSNTTATSFSVSIHTGSGTSIGSSVGSLSSSNLTAGINTFTSAGGIDLDANTTYSVVLDISSYGDKGSRFRSTTSNNEDSGGEAGWSIGDRISGRNLAMGSNWRIPTTTNVLEMDIKGYANPLPTTLVSNTGQADDGGTTGTGTYSGVYWQLGQSFTTGESLTGYTLSEVDVKLGTASHSSLTASIWTTDSDGHALSSLHNLTGPASFTTDALNTFTAPAGAYAGREHDLCSRLGGRHRRGAGQLQAHGLGCGGLGLGQRLEHR